MPLFVFPQPAQVLVVLLPCASIPCFLKQEVVIAAFTAMDPAGVVDGAVVLSHPPGFCFLVVSGTGAKVETGAGCGSDNSVNAIDACCSRVCALSNLSVFDTVVRSVGLDVPLDVDDAGGG